MENRSPGAVDEYRRHWVDQVVSNSQPEGAPRYTDLRRLIDGATRDAAEQAVAAGHYPTEDRNDPRGDKFDDYLLRAIDPIRTFTGRSSARVIATTVRYGVTSRRSFSRRRISGCPSSCVVRSRASPEPTSKAV